MLRYSSRFVFAALLGQPAGDGTDDAQLLPRQSARRQCDGLYRRRAEGEVGLIVTEAIGTYHPSSVGDTGLGETDLPIFNGPASVAAWAKVAE
jgi:hypothetical protein